MVLRGETKGCGLLLSMTLVLSDDHQTFRCQDCELQAATSLQKFKSFRETLTALELHSRPELCVSLQVASLDWLEKKAAAALYRSPPTSTLHDALENFLKVLDCCRCPEIFALL